MTSLSDLRKRYSNQDADKRSRFNKASGKKPFVQQLYLISKSSLLTPTEPRGKAFTRLCRLEDAKVMRGK